MGGDSDIGWGEEHGAVERGGEENLGREVDGQGRERAGQLEVEAEVGAVRGGLMHFDSDRLCIDAVLWAGVGAMAASWIGFSRVGGAGLAGGLVNSNVMASYLLLLVPCYGAFTSSKARST